MPRMKHCKVKAIRFDDNKGVEVEFGLTHSMLDGLTVLVKDTEGGELSDTIRRAEASLYKALVETAKGVRGGYLIED